MNAYIVWNNCNRESYCKRSQLFLFLLISLILTQVKTTLISLYILPLMGLLISLYLKFKSMRLKEKRVDIMFILCILELVIFITIHIILLYIFLKIRYNSVMKMFKRIKIILYINIDTQCR